MSACRRGCVHAAVPGLFVVLVFPCVDVSGGPNDTRGSKPFLRRRTVLLLSCRVVAQFDRRSAWRPHLTGLLMGQFGLMSDLVAGLSGRYLLRRGGINAGEHERQRLWRTISRQPRRC